MDWVSVIVVLAMLAAIIAVSRWPRLKGPTRVSRSETGGWVCTQCGHVGEQKRTARGSWLAEVFVWGSAVLGIVLTLVSGLFGLLFLPLFILPFLIYTIWQSVTEYDVCPWCNHSTMIPVDSPEGRRFLGERQRLPNHSGTASD